MPILALAFVAHLTVSTQAAYASTAGILDIEELDRLIVEQEESLHVFRCRFDVDAQLVPGGCSQGEPVLPVDTPPPFVGTPRVEDVVRRIRVIVAQESLLDVYRCRFGIETEVVYGGCTNVGVQNGLGEADDNEGADEVGEPDEIEGSASSAGWVSFDETKPNHPGLKRPRQVGVLTESITSAGLPEGVNAELVVACLYFDSEEGTTFRVYIDWNRFITSRISIYDLAVEFADGGSRALPAINSTINEASFVLGADESVQFAQSLIDSDGETVTASIFIPFGGGQPWRHST